MWNYQIIVWRYKEKDSRMPNWIELPVHPPEARRVQIHNLSQGTTYQFQVYRTLLARRVYIDNLSQGTTYQFQAYKTLLARRVYINNLSQGTTYQFQV